MSLHLGRDYENFPDILKKATIIHCTQDGDKPVISNYRSIAMIKVLDKLTEKQFKFGPLSFLDKHNPIN